MGWPKYETLRKAWASVSAAASASALASAPASAWTPSSPSRRRKDTANKERSDSVTSSAAAANPGRLQADLGVKPRMEDGQALLGRCRSAPAPKGDAGNTPSGSLAELTYARGEELLHDSPYSRELLRTRSRRRARHFYPSLQQSPPLQAWSNPPSIQHGSARLSPGPSAQHDAPIKQPVGRGLHSAARRSGSRAHRKRPIHNLPWEDKKVPLKNIDRLSASSRTSSSSSSPNFRLSIPLRHGNLDFEKSMPSTWEAADHDHQTLLSLTWPLLNPQTIGTKSKKKKKPAPPLSKICSAAQSISKELDRTMSKWQEPKEEKKDDETDTASRASLGSAERRAGARESRNASLERRSSVGDSGVLETEDVEEQGLDVERMKRAFMNFVEPGTLDLSIHTLLDLLRHVGHPVIGNTEAAVHDLVKEITSYEYLDYDEFMSFMELYVEHEKENFHEVFMSFDDDESGELDLRELRLLIKEVGLMSLSAMFKEAMETVDVDNNGQLDFSQFLEFIRIYLRNECFTIEEIDEIDKSMAAIRISENVEKEAGNGIPADLLSDVLVRFFGMHTGPDAKELQQKVIDRHILQNPRLSPTFYLSLKEVLLYGRQLREKYYFDLQSASEKAAKAKAASGKATSAVTSPAGNATSALTSPELSSAHEMSEASRLRVVNKRASLVEFQRFDDDGNSTVSESELRNALKTMQYEPLTVVIREVLNEVLPEPFEEGRELEFSEFFDFLLVYRQREGFRKNDVKELKSIFHRHDEDNSGDVSTLELGDIFRYMGYSLSVDELKKLVLIVDEDRSNELNFREYLYLMRLHRISVIQKMREAFNFCLDKRATKLARAGVLDALANFGITQPPRDVLEELADAPLDFEDFVSLADRCHRIKVSQERKKAGFSEAEMERVLDNFRSLDRDGSGEIDVNTELQRAFEFFGWTPKTAEEQQHLFGLLNRARVLAREAGVKDTSPEGSSYITMWEYVQLARMIRRQQETAEETQLAKLAQELKFSMVEVNEFRQVFQYWRKVAAGSDDEDSDEDGTEKPEVLSLDIMRRVVRSMGIKFTTETKELLNKKMQSAANGSLFINFHCFLHLMRWILDTDFGGLGLGRRDTLKNDAVETRGRRGTLKSAADDF